MSFRSRALFLALSLLAFPASTALAVGGAVVEGQVQDPQGKPVAGAAVTLLAGGGKASKNQTTDAQGSFHFEDLTSGVYTVTAALDGYAPVTCPGSRLLSGLTRRLEIKLAVTGGTSTCAPAAEPGS